MSHRNQQTKSRCFRPRLVTLLKYLKLSQYEDRLFGTNTPPQTHGYPRQAYVRALVLKIVLEVDYRELTHFLKRYRGYRNACGFKTRRIPHFTRFSKFFQKMDAEVLDEIVTAVIRKVFRKLKGPSKVVAVDSSLLQAFSNSFKKTADPDARTGKSATKGFIHGYKLHLAVDARRELPVSWKITAANRYDGHELLPLVRKAIIITHSHPRAVVGDKGYDAGYNYAGLANEMGIAPIIDLRRQRRRCSARQLSLDIFLRGQGPRYAQKHRRPRCQTNEQLLRHHPPIPRTSEEWCTLRPLRMAVERAIGRLKGWFGLERLWVRSLIRVRKVVALALLTWFVSVLYLIRRGRPGLIRSFPYTL